MPSQISINYGYGYTFRTGGGTPAPPLVAGANPPAQYAASGTTTLTFAFPAATGGTGPIVYAAPVLTAPPGSTASVSGTAPGNITINNAANGEGYLVRVYATDADGQQVLNDAIGAVEEAAPSSLVPGANPAEQYVAAGTSSISFTFNAASGGTAPLSYGAPVLIAPPGSTASVSGTAPGVVTINNAADEEAYLIRVYVTDGSGQQVLNDALASVAPAAPVPLVAGANPPAQYAASGTSTLTFAFPAASGGTPPYAYAAPVLVKPPGSTSTISGTAPGNITINNAADTEAYLIRVVVTDANGQQVLNDALGSIGEAAFVPLAPIVAPARQALAATATSASVTFTQPGAPPGMIYSASFADVTNGLAVTPSSGSGLGAYAFPVGSDKDYISIIAGTAPDGQVSTAVAQVAVAAAPALAWAAPAAAVTSAGVTSAAITWNTATGGKAPYIYGAAGAVYDSQAASTTAVLSTVGTPGTTTVSGLVNGQTLVVERSVRDAAGNVITVQGSVTVAATAAGVTPGAAPAAQALASDVTIATIGTWGAPSGGTGPYSYTVTEISNGGTLVAGSGLGVWQVSGLTSGFTFVFLLTVTDSLGAKGYSVTTISVAAALDVWEEMDELDFTDADWTAVSTTSTVASSVAWYLVLYAADGVTPRAYVYNNNTEARTLSLAPSGSGLTLVNGAITVQPTVGVWPAGWTAMIGGSRRDAWLIEAIVGGEEPAGALGFVHIFDVSTNTVTAASTPGTGLRNINSGTGTQIRVISYIGGAAEQAIQTIPTGATRAYTCGAQVVIADSRREDVHVRPNATDYGSPQSGQRVRVQATSTAMTAPGANVTTSASWFASTIADRTKFWLYHDGSATVGSRVRLLKLRLLRKINGSL